MNRAEILKQQIDMLPPAMLFEIEEIHQPITQNEKLGGFPCIAAFQACRIFC